MPAPRGTSRANCRGAHNPAFALEGPPLPQSPTRLTLQVNRRQPALPTLAVKGLLELDQVAIGVFDVEGPLTPRAVPRSPDRFDPCLHQPVVIVIDVGCVDLEVEATGLGLQQTEVRAIRNSANSPGRCASRTAPGIRA